MAATLLTSLKPISCVAVTSKQKQIDGVLRSIGKGQQVGFECLQMMAISSFLSTQQMEAFPGASRIPASDGYLHVGIIPTYKIHL